MTLHCHRHTLKRVCHQNSRVISSGLELILGFGNAVRCDSQSRSGTRGHASEGGGGKIGMFCETWLVLRVVSGFHVFASPM
mmetsp:Transcript_22172/g.54830  ORF Transcript_22172/g.54830 Transcript_22172/m.54830 type:complete len:81 (-) Transcript_22172:430-672(-)